MSIKEKLQECGIGIPEVLMPSKEIDLSLWSVIACDQYSSDETYWEKMAAAVGETPSTLNLILPECYLKSTEKKIPAINKTMTEYLKKSILQSKGEGFVAIERSTPWTKSRKGLLVMLDLEQYSYEEGASPLVRPTEKTILDRLPVRAEIRKEATLDLPHILVLFDDPNDTIFKRVEEFKKTNREKPLYDFDLCDDAGHLNGLLINDEKTLSDLGDLFLQLKANKETFLAVGDGNHSLGAAKQLWEKVKKSGGSEVMDHPARWALVELENIHDSGVNFHAIHRILFDVDSEDFLKSLSEIPSFTLEPLSGDQKLFEVVGKERYGKEAILGIQCGEKKYRLTLKHDEEQLCAEGLHRFLDPWLEKNPTTEIDYIHGDEPFEELTKGGNNIGFYLPFLDKNLFFDHLAKKGVTPRKTFSLGEAEEKRYYLESRKLTL